MIKRVEESKLLDWFGCLVFSQSCWSNHGHKTLTRNAFIIKTSTVVEAAAAASLVTNENCV